MTDELIRCKDCVYWMDRCVYMVDGRVRKYADGEDYVQVDVGINEGAKCLYDASHGIRLDGYAIFRDAEDFCSRAEKRSRDYDTHYGISDGFYEGRWK